MKVKDLIKQLESFNDLEAEVTVGGELIYFAELLPGYYDGCYQVLIQDKTCQFYNIKGMEITRKDKKVELHVLSINDIIDNCESLEEIEQLKFIFDPSLDISQKEYFQKKINLLKEQLIKELQ